MISVKFSSVRLQWRLVDRVIDFSVLVFTYQWPWGKYGFALMTGKYWIPTFEYTNVQYMWLPLFVHSLNSTIAASAHCLTAPQFKAFNYYSTSNFAVDKRAYGKKCPWVFVSTSLWRIALASCGLRSFCQYCIPFSAIPPIHDRWSPVCIHFNRHA